MSKELEAYDVVFNSFNNCTCQEGRFPVRSALDTIYQAIKRNEPMKPIKHNDSFGLCPICKQDLGRTNFCGHCGQRLDWEDK